MKERGDATVLNASRAGIDIPENVNDLKRWGEKWRPDYVILYQLSQTISSIAKRRLGGTRAQGGATSNHAEKAVGPITWVNRLVEMTTIYANAKGQISARIGVNRVLANDIGLQGQQEFSAMVHEFIDAVRVIGAVPVLATFATSHTRKHLPVFPSDVALGLFKRNSFLSVEGWVTSVERLNAHIKQISNEEGILLIDVEGAVAGRPVFFRDFIHFTPAGHEAVARVMSDALNKFEQIEPKSSIVQRGTIQ